jgi:hypothetical protein
MIFLWLVLALGNCGSAFGADRVPSDRPNTRIPRPASSIIQETKVLRHFPSLVIVTFKYDLPDHSFYFRTVVTDLDDPNATWFYDKITFGWFEAQLEHYYATGWAIEAFPPATPIPR